MFFINKMTRKSPKNPTTPAIELAADG